MQDTFINPDISNTINSPMPKGKTEALDSDIQGLNKIDLEQVISLSEQLKSMGLSNIFFK
ncbi:MAG: hypothetical protein ACJARD_000929 [Alphaproteobacteria bacterium]|jgi:hypothetical protein